jgi:hypothetical protein
LRRYFLSKGETDSQENGIIQDDDMANEKESESQYIPAV